MLQGQFQLPIAFDLTAVFLLALAGALLAMQKEYDLVGVFVLAFVSSVGGGLIRDTIFLGAGVPFVLTDYRYMLVIALGTLVAVLLGRVFERLGLLFLLVDALGLGMYAIVGADKTVTAGLGLGAAVFIGVINATGGGLLRDVIARDVPVLVRPGQYYAVSAFAGVVTFLGLVFFAGLPEMMAAVISIAVSFTLRVVSIRYNLTTKPARPVEMPPLPQRLPGTGWGWPRRRRDR